MNNAAQPTQATSPQPKDWARPVRVWLYVIALLVLLMVTIGGITRLTDSGLSITSWKPISGTLPPLSQADWQAEFDAYKHIPEFKSQNSWMELEEFKYIFWWEWGHRFLGRVIGLAFFVPFVVFLVQRRIPKSLTPKLAALFVLGGFQGFLGWWMVSSGLSERVDVSQYRLATHLGAACLLFAALIWVARRLTPHKLSNASRGGAAGFGAILALGVLVYVQLLLGAFVAGIDAGMAYNTWPLMDGDVIPNGLFVIQPVWKNFFENALTVQFNHRLVAYLIAIYVAYLLWDTHKKRGFAGNHLWQPIIGSMIALQIVLGIATLLAMVPIPLALGHQTLAFMIVGAITAYLADMRG